MKRGGIAEEIRFVHRAGMFRNSNAIFQRLVLREAENHGERFLDFVPDFARMAGF
jgi:hypothetical protein